MWQPMAVVAQSRRVDVNELTKFALANDDKYGICVEHGRVEVNTWHVDTLIADFKAISETCEN